MIKQKNLWLVEKQRSPKHEEMAKYIYIYIYIKHNVY